MPAFLQLLVTLHQVLLQMLRRWYVVAGCTLLCLLLVVLFARFRPHQYTTTMVVTSAESSSSGLSSAMNALNSGGGLLGLAVGGARSPQFANYLALLQSSDVSEKVMQDRHLMTKMFGDVIDPATGAWKVSFRRRLKTAIFNIFGVDRSPKPTLDDVQYVLNSMLVINPDPTNKSLATISCSSSDPQACREIMLAANKFAQQRLDDTALDSTRRMTHYLNSAVSNIDEVSVRQALTNVIANSRMQETLTSVGQDHANLLDGPNVPTMPSFPKPVLLIELAVTLGFVLGGALVWFTQNTPFDRALARRAKYLNFGQSGAGK